MLDSMLSEANVKLAAIISHIEKFIFLLLIPGVLYRVECADCATGDAAALVDCKTGAAAEMVDCENSSCGIVGELSDWGCSCVVGRLCD